MKPKYRIRRCEGNRECWLLVALRDDGTEIDSNGGWTTSYSVDALLKDAGHLTLKPGEIVELVAGPEPTPEPTPLPLPLPLTERSARTVKRHTREIYRDEGLIPAVRYYRGALWRDGKGKDPGLKTSVDMIRKWKPAK